MKSVISSTKGQTPNGITIPKTHIILWNYRRNSPNLFKYKPLTVLPIIHHIINRNKMRNKTFLILILHIITITGKHGKLQLLSVLKRKELDGFGAGMEHVHRENTVLRQIELFKRSLSLASRFQSHFQQYSVMWTGSPKYYTSHRPE